MRIFVYFVISIVSITPILTHISENNYIAAIVYGIFFMCVLRPFIKRFMAKSNTRSSVHLTIKNINNNDTYIKWLKLVKNIILKLSYDIILYILILLDEEME